MFVNVEHVIKHGDYNVIMFLLKKPNQAYHCKQYEALASFKNNDIRVFKYFLKHFWTQKQAEDMFWNEETLQTKHLFKKNQIILKSIIQKETVC